MNHMNQKFKSLSDTLKKFTTAGDVKSLVSSISFYLPSLFLLVLGLVAFTNPALLGVIVASIFLFFGLLFACLTWKVLQWKKKVENAFNQFGGQFIVQTYAMPKEENVVKLRRPSEDKKIIIH